MADKEKNLPENEQLNNQVSSNQETPSYEDKLKEAAESITKAHAESRARNSERVKQRIKAEKETNARVAEAEKRREENEKYAQKIAEKKIAEFDYAQNYRKKLLKEREEALSAAKQKRMEEREAALKEAREAKEQTVANFVEMEREEARQRNERADALLNSITKKDKSEQTPLEEKDALEEKIIPDDDPSPEADVTEIEEIAEAEEAQENSDANDVEETEEADVDDAEDGEDDDAEDGEDEDNTITLDPGILEKNDEDDGEFEMFFDEDGRLIIRRVGCEDSANGEQGAENDGAEQTEGDMNAPTEEELAEFRKKYDKALLKKPFWRRKLLTLDEDDELPDPEEFIIHDEIITAIKTEGARLDDQDEYRLKTYIKNSNNAIRNFEAALKAGWHAFEANRNEREAPAILAGVIKISGKILEIRCNNLENFVRIEAYKYVKDARTRLHSEIDRYNDYLVTYSALTGEQLTRMSTFLPENISAGRALSVVPELSYDEHYIQIFPDERIKEDASVIIPIMAPITANKLLEDIELPTNPISCMFYRFEIYKAYRVLQKEASRLVKLLLENRATKKRYENELINLEQRTPVAQRASKEYKDKVFRISVKFGKKLTSIKTVKTRSAFAKTRIRLYINRLAVEREKLILAYNFLRETFRVGKISQKKIAERFFVNAMISYNNCVDDCRRVSGVEFDKIPDTFIEQVCLYENEIVFPMAAYKRELVETVGESSRVISTAIKAELNPNEDAYAENSSRIINSAGIMRDTSSLSDESAMDDRASAIAKVILDALKESAEMVNSVNELEQFMRRSKRALRYFKKALKGTEYAIHKAFDEDGVITALVENLRVISNIIELRRINISVAMRIRRTEHARHHSRALYREIELYNGRAIDYMSIVGEQFSRISITTAKELMTSAYKLNVPVITYKDNYIEVFPEDPLNEAKYEKPRLHRAGYYTPLLMKNYRLTQNRAVETTVINSPFIFEISVDDVPVASWKHPIGFIEKILVIFQPLVAWFKRVTSNIEIWYVDASLEFPKQGVKNREKKNKHKRNRYERKLQKLNTKHNEKILALETVIHETDRHTVSYQKKLHKINSKFSRKVYSLKVRWMRDCPGRTEARLLLERLVLERERVVGINKVLLKYRNYGRVTLLPNVLERYKKKFVEVIIAHNQTASRLSELVGVKFSEISTAVADEIIRYGKEVRFPQIVCCRETIETINSKSRTIGDRWHGYGLYTGAADSDAGDGEAPVMSVGAMGYSTEMGMPFLRQDGGGMTILGMTAGGVPLIGFNGTEETTVPFVGTPMMLQGSDDSVVLDAGRVDQDSLILGAVNVNKPHSGINSAAVDPSFVRQLESEAKDSKSGGTTETPIGLDAKMLDERFGRALKARSMTTVDSVKTWWSLLGSEINTAIMRWLILRPFGFMPYLLPAPDKFHEVINDRVSDEDRADLERIGRYTVIIDIETKRLYSSVKAGIRRSQRVWSGWLYEDICKYNEAVQSYNSRRPGEKYNHLEMLSLNIPDNIIFRKDERPPAPPALYLRNRITLAENQSKRYNLDENFNEIEDEEDDNPLGFKSLTTEDLRDRLRDYARGCAGQQRWKNTKRKIDRGLEKCIEKAEDDRGLKTAKKELKRIEKIIKANITRTELRRIHNEARHYDVRFEKARAMKRYNNRTLRAIGLANDPIKYQRKLSRGLSKFRKAIFRVDFNMRIRQLVCRVLRIDLGFYLWGLATTAATAFLAALAVPYYPALQVITFIAIIWAAMPIILLLLRIVYEIVMLIVALVSLIFNIRLLKIGARDIEKNRYAAILECFVCAQHKVMLACEYVRIDPSSDKYRKRLIESVNDFNRRLPFYSKVLRIPLREIETSLLIEKLIWSDRSELTEFPTYVYVREVVERVDIHQVGKKIPKKEFRELTEEMNAIINNINLAASRNSVEFAALERDMTTLSRYLDGKIVPNEREKYELRRALIKDIEAFNLNPDGRVPPNPVAVIPGDEVKLFIRNANKIIDHLGGKNSRKIISHLKVDDMIN